MSRLIWPVIEDLFPYMQMEWSDSFTPFFLLPTFSISRTVDRDRKKGSSVRSLTCISFQIHSDLVSCGAFGELNTAPTAPYKMAPCSKVVSILRLGEPSYEIEIWPKFARIMCTSFLPDRKSFNLRQITLLEKGKNALFWQYLLSWLLMTFGGILQGISLFYDL